jgi:hypothetical protein
MPSDPPILPDHVLSKMSKEDRDKLGRAGMTYAEGAAKYESRLERHRHGVFSQFLHLKGYEHLHANPTKRSTIEPGWPDYSLFPPHAQVFFIEFKTEEGTLSEDQKRVIARLRGKGYEVFVLTDVREAIKLTDERFTK